MGLGHADGQVVEALTFVPFDGRSEKIFYNCKYFDEVCLIFFVGSRW